MTLKMVSSQSEECHNSQLYDG